MKIPLGAWVLGAVIALSMVLGGQYATENGLLLDSAFLAALSGSSDTPLLTHAFLAFPVLLLLGSALVRRQVVQVPTPSVSVAVLFLAALLCASVAYSLHRGVSLALLPEWLTYLAAIYAAVATVGRRAGPKLIVAGGFLGGTIVALRGVAEYGEMKSIDPNWRIFGGWLNPNATAIALAVGFLCGLTIILIEKRAISLIAIICTALIGLALLLTQSKGGILVTAMGSVMVLVMTALWSDTKLRSLGSLAAAIVLAGLLGVAATPRAAPTANGQGSGGFNRLQNASDSSQQSTEFRKNLYVGALEMLRANPVGYGLGAYRFESARSGLTTQTVLTHNAFLQLGTEASVLAPLVLLTLGGWWLWLVLRGTRSQPVETRLLKGGIVAAVTTIAAHSFIDSDLYYFGIGLPFFLLIGTGLLLASDAVTPEYTPRGPRLAGATSLAVIVLLALLAGLAESQRAYARAAIRSGQGEAGVALAKSAEALWPMDGEAPFLQSRVLSNPSERLALLQSAVAKSPSTRNIRALADVQIEMNDTVGAMASLDRALTHDPNNLPALAMLLEISQKAGNRESSEQAARRLVEVEDTPYFKVRSLDQLVPTETYRARIYLASLTNDPAQAISLLKPAVAGFASYADLTIPEVKKMDAASSGSAFAGETLKEAQANMELATQAAKRLAGLQRSVGDPAGAEATDVLAARLESAAK
ncbi:tetratricopeptide repeat protein [bacterium]|nr:MAG: tetratricopeptide repeat protein [bacterium]